MPNRLWIVPANDLEALEIHALLAEHGEAVLRTDQPWGASWEKLEPKILAEVLRFQKSGDGTVFGVELGGKKPAGAENIDHHYYPGDDRSNPLSSIEQVAKILGVGLSRERQLVAANDKGWIPSLREAGASSEEIAGIRKRDRAAQGITSKQEEQARTDVAGAKISRGVAIVECSGLPTSAHTDFLEPLALEILLKSPDRWSYSGPRHKILAGLKLKENHWSGGKDERGYFGIEKPSEESQGRIMDVIDTVSVEHCDLTLFWPIRLRAGSDLNEVRKNPNASPGEWLKQHADFLSGDSPWTRVPGSFAGKTIPERQFDYAEFIYYHPFARDLLFHRKREETNTLEPCVTLQRTDLKEMTVNLSEANLTIRLEVVTMELRLLLTDVAILVVRLRVPGPTPLRTAMHLLNQVRRVVPPYWKEEGGNWSPGQVPLKAHWADQDKSITDNTLFEDYFLHVEKTHTPPLMSHWAFALLPLKPWTDECQNRHGLFYEQLGDDRAFLAASLLVSRYDDITDPEWMRLAFVDEGGGSWVYNPDFLMDTEVKKHHFYDRFRHWQTRYLVTGYSFLQVCQMNDFSSRVLREHFLHHYYRLCLLAVLQKSSILVLSARLSELLKRFIQAKPTSSERDRYHRECRWLANDFATYMALYDFAEVSNQLQGIELFDMLRGHLHTPRLFQELHQQITFAVQQEFTNYQESITTTVNRWLPVSLALAILGFSYAMDIYSSKFFNENHSADFFDVPRTIALYLLPIVLAVLVSVGSYQIVRRYRDWCGTNWGWAVRALPGAILVAVFAGIVSFWFPPAAAVATICLAGAAVALAKGVWDWIRDQRI